MLFRSLLLRSHGVETRLHNGDFDPALLDAERDEAKVDVVTGELARGLKLPSRKLAAVTEEEIFGARASRFAQAGRG